MCVFEDIHLMIYHLLYFWLSKLDLHYHLILMDKDLIPPIAFHMKQIYFINRYSSMNGLFSYMKLIQWVY